MELLTLILAISGIFLWLYGVKKLIFNNPNKKEKSNGN